MILQAFQDILKSGQKYKKEELYANMIEEADGLDKIEHLQYHTDENIYNKTVFLIENYFGGSGEAYLDIAPINNTQGFNFDNTQPQQTVFSF